MKVNIKKFPKGPNPQKIDIEIERFDTWSMYHTLAEIIYPMLLQLKAEKHGVPAEFGEAGGEDYLDQQSFDFYKQDASWAFEEKIKQWDIVLDKMIWSFSQIIDEDWESKYHHGTHETDWVESDTMHKNPISGKMEKTFQMVDRNPDGHWYDSDGHRLHMERIQEGLELFGKYYQNLWD